MNAIAEKKASGNKDQKLAATDNQADAKQAAGNAAAEKVPFESLRDALAKLDAERASIVKDAIENLKPGKRFDSSVIRSVNKLETKKNRVIVSHFASLLRKGGPEIQTLVFQIVEL